MHYGHWQFIHTLVVVHVQSIYTDFHAQESFLSVKVYLLPHEMQRLNVCSLCGYLSRPPGGEKA